MASVTIDLDLPEGVTIGSYERCGPAHAFLVNWPWPEQWRCQRCGHEAEANWECTGKMRVLRDLDVCGQPGFWTYEAAFHRCERCHHRQDLIPHFKRKDASYTLRFEELVVRMLVGSTETEVALRLGISAETVARIVKHQVADAKAIDPKRVITDVGIDEISMKKRHKLYVTILTDLTDPNRPQTLAVVNGRDEEAARHCLELLTPEQRAAVQYYRADMSAAYNKACTELLPNAKGIIDRFHLAKLFNDAIDGERKKITHAHKAKLTKAQRKEFRSLMWEFRRDPDTLTDEERTKLERLFERLPRLRTLYELRVRFKTIFDEGTHRRGAGRALLVFFWDATDAFPELEKFVCTYERWQEQILNYFDDRRTSGVVEGINNKARVITKRAYGLKNADSLWTRLLLDLNRAKDIMLYTIASIHEMAKGIQAVFSMACG